MKDLHNKIGDVRERIEDAFGRWSQIVFRFKWLIVISTLVFVGALSPQLENLRVETSVDGILTEDDPGRIVYDNFRHEFGRDEMMLLLIDADPDKGIFDIDFLRKLQVLHRQIENEVGQIQEVNSLVNARDTRGFNDELIVQDLMEEFPQTQAELDTFRQRVLDSPLIRSTYLSKNMNATVIMIKTDSYSTTGVEGEEIDFASDFEEAGAVLAPQQFISAEENADIVKAIKNIVAQRNEPGFSILLGGTPVLIVSLSDMLLENVTLFSAVSLVLIVLLLAIIYRRLDICFIPPFVALLTLIFTLSLMTFLNIPISMTIQMMPTFILAISVANSVHLFTSFFQAIHRGDNKQQALRYAMEHSALAITMTGLTTAGGLMSFATAEVQPVIEFGIITPIGIICALIFTLTFLPALIAVMPLRAGTIRDTSQSPVQRFMRWCALLSTRSPYLIVSFWTVWVAISLVLISQITVSHNMLKWFPEDNAQRVQTERMNTEFSGPMFLEVLIDTKRENGLHDPDILNRMEALDAYARTLGDDELYVGNTVSLINVNKELHKALNNNDDSYYRIPQDKALVTQELFLFENTGSDDLSKLVDSQFSMARMTMTVPFISGERYPALLEAIDTKSQELFSSVAEITLTGMMSIMGRTVEVLITSMMNSYIIAIVIITPLMMLLLGSVRSGLLSMIPNVAPIIITLGVMGLLGIPIDLFTLLIGSIALGLAVDDTIHFMHNYQRFYHRSGDSEKAVADTLRTTGTALAFTSIILGFAFIVYTASSMNNLRVFGALTCFCIIVAFFADILLAPALMTLRSRYHQSRVTRLALGDSEAEQVSLDDVVEPVSFDVAQVIQQATVEGGHYGKAEEK